MAFQISKKNGARELHKMMKYRPESRSRAIHEYRKAATTVTQSEVLQCAWAANIVSEELLSRLLPFTEEFSEQACLRLEDKFDDLTEFIMTLSLE